MELSNHQRRLLENMINLIHDYLTGNNRDFYNLVGKLEGALDAANIQDDTFVNQWYELWTPLEIRRSIEGNDVNKLKAISELQKMKDFLSQSL